MKSEYVAKLQSRDYELQEDISLQIDSKNRTFLNTIYDSARSINNSYTAGSIKSSISLVMASALGCGVFYMPYAIYCNGIYLGIFIILFNFWCTYFANYCLIQASIKTNRVSYYGIAEVLFGAKYGSLVELAVVFECYDCLVVYIIDIQMLFCNGFNTFGYGDSLITSHMLWGLVVTILILFPISLYREISALRYTSIISFISAAYLLIVLICECIYMRYDDFGNRLYDGLSERPMLHATTALSVFLPLSKINWAFTCQPNILAIYDELEYRNLAKGVKSLLYGLGIVSIFYIVIGIFGFILFYDEGVKSNILNDNFNSSSDDLIATAFIASAFIILGKIHLRLYPCRDGIYSSVWPSRIHIPTSIHVCVVTLLVFSAMTAAMLIENSDYMVMGVSSILNPLVYTVLPCMFYLTAFKEERSCLSIDYILCYIVMIAVSAIGICTFVVFWMSAY